MCEGIMKYKIGDILTPNPTRSTLHNDFYFLIEAINEETGWYHYRCLQTGRAGKANREYVDLICDLVIYHNYSRAIT